MTDNIEHLKWLHEALCSQIDREFELLGQRMIWLVTSNAFLFTVMAILHNNENQSVPPDPVIVIMKGGIPILGILICSLAYITMYVARVMVRKLKANRVQVENEIKKKLDFDFEITVSAKETGHILGNLPYWILPLAISVIWIYIIDVQWM